MRFVIPALIALGVLLGFVSARLVDVFALNPLVAPLACAAGAVVLAVIRRRQDFPLYLAESFVFTYSAVVGMILVRATPANHLAVGPMHRFADWFDSPNPLVLLGGLALSAAMICLVCVPAWALAQRFERGKADERDQRFSAFIASRLRDGDS